MIIAAATPADAAELGRVHVQAWREAYPAIVPAAVLDALDSAERAAMWTRVLNAGEAVWLARDSAGTLQGFAAAGPQRQAMLAATEAWNTDFCFLYADIAGTGLLPVEAENQGKVVITTEMGGSENVTAQVHALTQGGLRNVLVHSGIIEGKITTRASLGQAPTRWVQALDWEDYRFAPESGIFENIVPLGTKVAAGETVGAIHFLECPDRACVNIQALSGGILIATRAPSVVSQGDCVAVIAQEVAPRRLP